MIIPARVLLSDTVGGIARPSAPFRNDTPLAVCSEFAHVRNPARKWAFQGFQEAPEDSN